MTDHSDRPDDTDSILLNYAQAAHLLNISERCLWSLAKANQIPHLRIRRAVRFRRESLLRWIERREQGAKR